jgi:hypothetical protein
LQRAAHAHHLEDALPAEAVADGRGEVRVDSGVLFGELESVSHEVAPLGALAQGAVVRAEGSLEVREALRLRYGHRVGSRIELRIGHLHEVPA